MKVLEVAVLSNTITGTIPRNISNPFQNTTFAKITIYHIVSPRSKKILQGLIIPDPPLDTHILKETVVDIVPVANTIYFQRKLQFCVQHLHRMK